MGIEANQRRKPAPRPLDWCKVAAIAALLNLFGVIAPAQNAFVSGRVIDPSGAVVPGAEVQLQDRQTETTLQTQSNQEGLYVFPFVKAGEYALTANAQGFKAFEQSQVQVEPARTLSLDIRLEVGQVSETVTVESDPAVINTTDATVGNAFGTQSILQLPLNARNPAGLLSLQPGVTYLTADPLDPNYEDIRNGSVNGARTNQSNITLDGVDVNARGGGESAPFTSVLRNTLDSIEAFRVVTTTANADMGRSSGAQVSLVTKSGTNELHGSLYEFHRNTATAANNFFNNRSGVERPKLIRNVFGASAGGPIVKNRLFLFANYEGRRDASDANVVRAVPTASLRQGTVKYFNNAGGVSALSPEYITSQIDPLGIGPNPDILNLFKSYPMPNDTSVGDGINTAGYRFTAPTPLSWNTAIAKLDWNLDRNGAHSMFLRGNMQDDRIESEPQFPGQGANQTILDNSRGLAFGYTAVLSPAVVSTLRYGITRQGVNRAGVQTAGLVGFHTSLDLPVGATRSLSQVIPVHTLSEDLSWTRGSHQVQFGGIMRRIRNQRVNFENSFHDVHTAYWNFLDNADELLANVNDFASDTEVPLKNDLIQTLGILGQGTGRFNYDIEGNLQPLGSPVKRMFGSEEYELYLQDTWRARAGLTLTAGLRWSLMPPVREVNGVQVTMTPGYDEFVARRLALAEEGRPTREAGALSFVPRESPQGRPLYPFHKNNFAPRFALAYSPQASDGFWGKLFGGPGKTSIRAGAGMFYDQFGMGLMQVLDRNAFGLSSMLSTPIAAFDTSTAPRYSGVTDIPDELIPEAPAGGPGTPPDAFANSTAVNNNLRAPYTMNLTFSVGRQLRGGFVLEAAYVGRLSRRTLVSETSAVQQANLRDPASGQLLFDALRNLDQQARSGVPVEAVRPVGFFENVYSNAATTEMTATQRVYEVIRDYSPDAGSALADLDAFCSPFCSDLGPHAFFIPQFWGLSSLGSVGTGSYHAMQWTLRKRFSQGVQFDLNYTLSKSIDLNSYAEGEQGGNGATSPYAILSNWNRGQHRGVSDFDIRHQVNANWVVELPFGRGRPFLDGSNGVVEALLGGWQVSGLLRQTSGLPLSVTSLEVYPTNWCCAHLGTAVGEIPQQTQSKNTIGIDGAAGPNVFSDPAAALSAFDTPMVGEIGSRNPVRADGFFSIDLGVGKRFALPWESHSLQFRAEAFNVTNSVSFRGLWGTMDMGVPGAFGRYSSTSVPARVVQFGLRYEF